MRSLELRRLLKFAVVGVMNTGIDVALFAILVYSLGLTSIVAQTLSYFIAFLNSYLWNRRWTFAVENRSSAGELTKFLVVNVISFLFATGILLAAEKGLELSPIVAKLVSVFASLAVNYTGSKLWVFRSTAPRAEPGAE